MYETLIYKTKVLLQMHLNMIQLFANRNKDVLCKLAMYCPKAYDVRTSTFNFIM